MCIRDRTSLTLDRHKGRSTTYDVERVGLNYRIDEIRSAIGLVQLDKLIDGNARRKQHTDAYRLELSDMPVDIPFSELKEGVTASYHIMPVLLPGHSDRTDVMSSMKENGVQTSIHYPPFWSFSAYASITNIKEAPVVAEICERELTLPLYPTMTDEQRALVVSSLAEALS